MREKHLISHRPRFPIQKGTKKTGVGHTIYKKHFSTAISLEDPGPSNRRVQSKFVQRTRYQLFRLKKRKLQNRLKKTNQVQIERSVALAVNSAIYPVFTEHVVHSLSVAHYEQAHRLSTITSPKELSTTLKQ